MFTNMHNCRVSYKLRYNMRHICLPRCITVSYKFRYNMRHICLPICIRVLTNMYNCRVSYSYNICLGII